MQILASVQFYRKLAFGTNLPPPWPQSAYKGRRYPPGRTKRVKYAWSTSPLSGLWLVITIVASVLNRSS